MNYIYDIVLNFQKNYYNFFEWNRIDNIKNIYKIPLYHLKDEDLIKLKNNKVTVSIDFINKIKEENPKSKKIICLVSNGKLTIGLLFDKDGNLKKRSSLIFEEEIEANNLAKSLPITKIEYQHNIDITPANLIRIEKEKKETLKLYINNLTDLTTLKYLYYEYFNEECNEILKMKSRLLQEVEKEWNIKKNNLYKIISLLIKNKLPSK